MVLLIVSSDPPVGKDGGAVINRAVALWVADNRNNPFDVPSDPFKRLRCVGQDVLFEQQILWRVAGQSQLG